MKKRAPKVTHDNVQIIPLFGDTTQDTSDVEFVRHNLAAYPSQAKAFVALNGRTLLPITGHFAMLDNNVLIMNVGTTICPACKPDKHAKPPHEIIAEIIGQTAHSIAESNTTGDGFNELIGGVLAGIHQAIHHIGITSREEAMQIVAKITETLTNDINECWDPSAKPPISH